MIIEWLGLISNLHNGRKWWNISIRISLNPSWCLQKACSVKPQLIFSLLLPKTKKSRPFSQLISWNKEMLVIFALKTHQNVSLSLSHIQNFLLHTLNHDHCPPSPLLINIKTQKKSSVWTRCIAAAWRNDMVVNAFMCGADQYVDSGVTQNGEWVQPDNGSWLSPLEKEGNNGTSFL